MLFDFPALATIVIITNDDDDDDERTSRPSALQVLFRPREKAELHIFRTEFLLFSDAANSASLRPGRRFYERRI